MSIAIYIVSAVLVFIFSGLLAMAGLGAAFLFVPLFYYLGVPLAEATPTALLLNVVSLLFATINYWRGKLINWRVGLPVLVMAVILSPLGARLTASVDKTLLLGMFAAFLVFAGFMMLFYKAKKREQALSRPVEIAAASGVGSVAGFLGGLLGVGGGNFILPVLNWLGLDAKVAAGTTALVVVFSSLSGFLGHATLGGLDPLFIGIMAMMAAAGSFEFHAHECPFMPIGYRMGKLALEYLGVEKEPDHGFFVFPEQGEGHPHTCMMDGMQIAAGGFYPLHPDRGAIHCRTDPGEEIGTWTTA